MKVCVRIMTIKYNEHQKSMKIRFVIHADTESLVEKIQTCDNNAEKLFTSNINSIKFVVIHYSHVVHLIATKLNLTCA